MNVVKPHGALEGLRSDSKQLDGFVHTQVGLFEVAEQHFGKYAARGRQQQLVTLEILPTNSSNY
jgi:hypothetical protein